MSRQRFMALVLTVIVCGIMTAAGAMTEVPKQAIGMAITEDTLGSGNGYIHIVPTMSSPSLKNNEKATIQAVVKAAAGVASVEARIERETGMPLNLELPVAFLKLNATKTPVESIGLWQTEWTAYGLEEGYYRVVITVTDKAGHSHTDRSLRFSDPIAGNNVAGTDSYSNGGLLRLDNETFVAGEDQLSCAVIDYINGYAWFGTNTAPGQIIKVALGSGYTPPVRLGTLTLNSGENYLVSAVYDHATETGYFGTNTLPGLVVKVVLASGATLPVRVGALTLNSGENYLYCGVLDSGTQYAYFGTGTSPGRVVKIGLGVGLTPFARIGAITLSSMAGENILRCAVLDSVNQYAYFGTNTSPGRVVKVGLGGAGAPTYVGSLGLQTGENNLSTAVISVSSQFAWFGTNTSPGRVVKINLNGASTPTRVGACTFIAGEDSLVGGSIDVANQSAWFATNTAPGNVVKIDIGAGNAAPSRLGAITLSGGEDQITCGCLDLFNGYAYYGTDTAPGQVVRVAVSQKGFVKGTQFTMPEPGLLDSVSFYSHVSAGETRVSLYDTSADPALIWEGPAAVNATSADWITTDVGDGLPTSLLLSAGNYYVAWQVYTTASVPSYTLGGADEGFLVPYEWSAFPAALQASTPTERVMTTDRWSAYITYTGPPNVQSVAVLDGHTVRVTFTKDMSADAELAATYTLSGTGQGSLAATPDSVTEVSPTEYDLSWSCPSLMLSGGDITVTVDAAITDTLGIPMGLTQSGTDAGGAVATLPTATLTPSTEPLAGECNVSLTLPSRTWLDGCGASIGETSVNLGGLDLVNPATGTYTVTFTATDGVGNVGTRLLSVEISDTIIPVITLGGATPVTVECGGAYADAGATAADSCDGDLTGSIITVNPVNTGVVGGYTVTYNVSDAASNAATEVTRTVNVVDTAAPTIALNGISPVTVECGSVYADAGATASDACDGDLTGSIATVNSVNANAVGSYIVTYNVADGALNTATEVTRTVNVVDTTAPLITLTGNNPEAVECGSTYTDAGATAADDCEGDLTASIAIVNSVNASAVGSYTVTYNVSDSSTNVATEVVRTVNVVDTTAPVITLTGNNPETVECSSTYTDAGATAADDCEGDLTASIATVNSVNASAVGSYTVTYNVSDSASNVATEVVRTVNVVDTTAPLITLTGNDPETVECGSTYTDAGATAADDCEGDLTASIATVNSVNASAVGSYTVTYNVSDSSSNAATEVVRTVNVADTTAPLITLTGNNPEAVECGSTYTDAGATAADDCEGDLTASIAIVNSVNASAVGSYTVTYNVSDSSSNAATEVVRTVNVVDTTAPLISLVGLNPVTAECGIAYVDAGATAADGCDGSLTGSLAIVNNVNTAVVGSYTVTYNVSDGASNAATEVVRTVNVVDTTAPLIARNGTSPVTVECGAVYADAGATAIDVCEGVLTSSIVTFNPVNVNVPATYTVRYNVSDSASNAATEVTRTVNVVDTTAPIITLSGNAFVLVECGAVYTDAGATAIDGCDGDLTTSIVTANPVNTSSPGTYQVTYNVSDAASNAAAQQFRTVQVSDTTAPVITLVGSDPETVECGDVYTDAGATASDDCDGDLSGSIATVNSVNTAVTGVYTVTYNVSDTATNTALEVIRNVNVVDTTAPVITLLGSSPETVECGDVYTDAGATAADDCDGDLSGSIATVNPVNTTVAGVYTVTYNVSDAALNAATEVTRTVNVVDTTAPTIALSGTSPVTVECGNAYADAGATATDDCDGDLTGAIAEVNSVDTNLVGSYTVTYNVSDGASNTATEVVRTVNVVDTTPPVINLLGLSSVIVNLNDTYTDDGATAADDCDGDLTASIVVGGDTVDTSMVDTYVITYNVTDGAGLAATEVTRTVDVVDITQPFVVAVNVLSASSVEVIYNKDMGAGANDPANYTVSGTGMGTLTVNPDGVSGSGTTWTLTWSGCPIMFAGGDITVTVDISVQDSIGNAMKAPFAATDAGGAIAAIPVITLNGSDPVTLECGDVYTDAGAMAADQCTTDLTASIVTVNPVDDGVAGVYTVAYNVADVGGNAALEVTRTVNVVDTIAPVITRAGSGTVAVGCGSTYTDAGATASDACDGDLTASIATVNPVDTGVPGAYTVTYDVSDSSANAAIQVTRTVNVVDSVPPVITLLGSSQVSVQCGSAYTDAGATASDTCEGDLTASIVTVNPVNTTVAGAYTVTYNVSDASSNVAIEVTRTVNVVDTTAPIIIRTGNAMVLLECGDAYTDAGATASDVCDGDLTASIATVNPVDTGVPGSYTVTYNVSDAASNAATEVTRTVNVADNTAPVLTMNGSNPETVECGNSYTDAGATANDVCDGDLTASIVTVNPVDTGVTGSYTITYNVSDSASNAAAQVTRTVDVVDTLAPTITRLGNATVSVECGNSYTDAGATASDVCDGDLTASIVTVNSVDTGAEGSYLVTYDVSDSASNAAAQVTRTVNVLDTQAPVITLSGTSPVTVNFNETYTDAGATAMDVCEGDLTVSIVTVNPVDTTTVGIYVVTYNVSDSSSNAATEVTRTVNVADTTNPYVVSVTVLDEHTIQVVFSKPMGAGASDIASYTVSGDGLGTFSATPEGVIMVSASVYNLTWSCPAIMSDDESITVTASAALVDDIGNAIVAPLEQTHVDGGMAQAPQITLTPDVTELTGECGVALTQPSRSATDECGNAATMLTTYNFDGLSFSNPVVGTYTLIYRAQDAADNLGIRYLTVNIADTTPPVITLLGDNPQEIGLNDPYVEQGATVSDACEGDISGEIVVDASTVDTSVIGSYIVTYNAQDSVTNAALEVTRTVEVIDTSIPLGVEPIADIEIAEGDSDVLSAIPTGGTGTIYYQWLKDDGTGTFVTLSDGAEYTGAQTATLTLNAFSASMVGLYKVEVSDDLTTVETTATVTLAVPLIPVASTFGLAMLASATALGGAFALRRRR